MTPTRSPGKSSSISSRPKTSHSSKRKATTPRKSVENPSTSHARERKKPRPRVLKEIMKQQRSTQLCIKKLPFSRLVREIQQRQNPRITHWKVEALAALQEAAEAYIVRFLEDCNEAARFCRRVTVMKKDFQFINKLRGKYGPA